ncbi:serine/threonine-protein kinase [Kitasatospora sp. NPDC058170]|uniref:serine/threonine-protein kinase n=1 Tax=Kitasatospora sp. NPDC058170 TaxID=3346364 RepID=UPI0036DD2D9B
MTATNGDLIGGRYRLLELIGQGGMGRVWRGRDETLGRDVAVKEVLLPPGVTDEQRNELVQRVLREARAAARLNHPGIITVHDVVEHEGAPLIVMEYVVGTSLAAEIARDGALPVRRVAEIGVAMLKALQRAHAVGIVHRDLKPDNVLLMDDRVIITDFGIAHMTDATTALTRTGAVIGTPAYMAPEQLEGRPPAAANDLWSLGATLYSAVEGEAPFSATTFSALCIAVVTQAPRTPLRAGALIPVLAALLTKDPAQRATAEQALAALEHLVHTGEAAVLPTPTEVSRPAPPAAPPAGYQAYPSYPSTAPAHLAAPAAWPPAPAPAPGPVPGAVFGAAPTAVPVAAAGAAAVSATSAVLAVLVRFIGCMALIWITGTTLPWNYWAHIGSDFLPTAIGITAVLSLLNAVPRPGWHPAAAWAAVVGFDVLLYFATKQVLLQTMGIGDIGFGEAPVEITVNMLIVGTGAWLLWWTVPGSRPATRG